jgi:two-component system phosphate regulon response regulator PhoB
VRSKAKILVAEDEPGMLRLIESNLLRAGFVVGQVTHGDKVAARVRAWKPALLVLDVMLPDLSGFDVCRQLKSDPRTRELPIVMLTAKAQERDRVRGLELGADDYVTKPFSPRELILRIQAQLRKVPAPEIADETVRVGKILVDRAAPAVHVAGRRLVLTATEFKLLAVLMERVGRVQTRERLLSDVWGYEAAIESRTVDIYVTRLRGKLGRAGAHLETVRGFGYRLVEKPER